MGWELGGDDEGIANKWILGSDAQERAELEITRLGVIMILRIIKPQNR